MKSFLFSLAFFLMFNVQAQLKHCLDTIRYDLKQNKSWFLSLDGKNSVIRDLRIKLFGLQFGYLYNKRTNLYIGYYGSYNNETQKVENNTSISASPDTNAVYVKYNIGYFNFGCEYYFHNSRKWRFSIPVALGIGMGSEQKFTKYKNISQRSSTIMPLDFGLTASYKIKWWLWAGAGLGYRQTIGASKYGGAYYTFGLSLKFGEMYNRVNKWYKENYALNP